MGFSVKKAAAGAGWGPIGAAVGGLSGDKNAKKAFSDITATDPMDLLGSRRKKEEKARKEREKKAAAARKKESAKIAEKMRKEKVARANEIQAQTIAKNKALLESQARAAENIAFLKNFGQSKGPSSQAQYLLDKANMEEQTGLDQQAQEQGTRGQEAFSQLASQGGAEAGSRERMFGGLQNEGFRQQQNQRRQAALNRIGISSDDEARKLSIMQSLPGLEMGFGQNVRSGLQADQDAGLRAAMTNQGMSQNANNMDFAGRQQANMFEAGVFGAESMSEAQREAQRQRAEASRNQMFQLPGFMQGFG